jgi:hypothetical protein
VDTRSRSLTVVRDFVLFVVGVFAAAAAVLYLVDARGQFGTGIFPVVVSQTRADKSRLFLEYHRTQPVEGLVIGSSRSMRVSPTYLSGSTGLRFFNFGVDDARAEDILAIVRWSRAHGATPRLAIIGLDIEALHDDDEPDPEFLTDAQFRGSVSGYDDVETTIKTYKSMFTIWYAIDTLTSLRVFLRHDRRPRYHFEADGHLRDETIDALRAKGEPVFADHLDNCIDVYMRRFARMTKLSARRRGYVEQAVAEIHKAGGRSLVWITPLHPVAIARLEAATKYRQLHEEAAAFLAQLRSVPGVETLDLSDPDLFGGVRSVEWDDCAHPDDAEEGRIAARLVASLDF